MVLAAARNSSEPAAFRLTLAVKVPFLVPFFRVIFWPETLMREEPDFLAMVRPVSAEAPSLKEMAYWVLVLPLASFTVLDFWATSMDWVAFSTGVSGFSTASLMASSSTSTSA